jgi:hypothetical protein
MTQAVVLLWPDLHSEILTDIKPEPSTSSPLKECTQANTSTAETKVGSKLFFVVVVVNKELQE